ncbi:MAG TPA: BadF/BadG/BcrA/BcrD ATPase family protein, partial [Pyrinomonadaceae bacterium]|nr:BadF/BadG/BcrA/BcrD ATPase family protein [Pyrinomonadaceae bacterium]
IADAAGLILGRGIGGASNHAEQPGGRERLRNAILDSVGEALGKAGLPQTEQTIFASAHCGMTGGADYKEEIIAEIIKADKLTVGHDAPTALASAVGGGQGIVVIAGTGSIVYGENERGEIARIGGLGFLFSDEGSGFWLALQIIKLAIKEQDGLIAPAGLQRLVLDFFRVKEIRELTTAFYNEKVSRDEIASLAKAAHEAALAGNEFIAAQIRSGAEELGRKVKVAAKRLGFLESFTVAGVGGMFRAELMRKYFQEFLQRELPEAAFTKPRFNPAVGALLLAYCQGGIEINENLLINLENSGNK